MHQQIGGQLRLDLLMGPAVAGSTDGTSCGCIMPCPFLELHLFGWLHSQLLSVLSPTTFVNIVQNNS